MLNSLFAYIDGHTWAQWALSAFVFVPPMLIIAAQGARGFSAIGVIFGWLALLLIVALILV